jgi:hypothetical protein
MKKYCAVFACGVLLVCACPVHVDFLSAVVNALGGCCRMRSVFLGVCNCVCTFVGCGGGLCLLASTPSGSLTRRFNAWICRVGYIELVTFVGLDPKWFKKRKSQCSACTLRSQHVVIIVSVFPRKGGVRW